MASCEPAFCCSSEGEDKSPDLIVVHLKRGSFDRPVEYTLEAMSRPEPSASDIILIWATERGLIKISMKEVRASFLH